MIEDQIIEAMARAMCIADGDDPDQVYTYPNGKKNFGWEERKCSALRQYRAYLAMQSVILSEAPQKPQEHEKAPKGLQYE